MARGESITVATRQPHGARTRGKTARRFSGCPRARAGFTLIEILISTLIIAMLMLMGFASNRALRESARKRQAEIEVRAIEQAMLAFRQTYGTWPLMDKNGPGKVAVSNVIAILANDIPLDCQDQEMKNANPRGIAFLALPGTKTGAGVKYADPWGNQYMMGVRWDDGDEYTYKFLKDCDSSGCDFGGARPDATPVLVWAELDSGLDRRNANCEVERRVIGSWETTR